MNFLNSREIKEAGEVAGVAIIALPFLLISYLLVPNIWIAAPLAVLLYMGASRLKKELSGKAQTSRATARDVVPTVEERRRPKRR